MIVLKKWVIPASLAFVLAAVPGAALAGGNEIDQGSFDAEEASASDIFSNEAFFAVGAGKGVGYGGFDSAAAAANCQLISVADAWVVVIAANGALGLISDEDEVAITAAPTNGMGDLFNFDEENATASCRSPVGPVSMTVLTADGWGELSPNHGSWAEVTRTLRYGGGGGGGTGNRIDQGSFEADADVNDAITNDADFELATTNGAVAAANCQAIIGVHMGAAVIAANGAAAQIEDSDSVVITGGDASTAAVSPTDARADLRRTIEIENDHHAKAWCEQPIESIDLRSGRAR